MLKFRRVLAMPSNPLDCSHDPSRTRQEFAADADINNIVRRFLRDGVLPQPNAARPTITDGLSVPGDFQEACEVALDYQRTQEMPKETAQEAPKETQEAPKETQEAPKDAQE